jgi:NADP-dependent 3-hydroxy acid dehydrogenase YdfG
MKISHQYPLKRAFVTGAASGLGLAICSLLAIDGWTIGMADIHEADLEEAVRKISGLGGKPLPYVLDVCLPSEYEAVSRAFLKETGGIDLLFNNAGIAAGGPFKLAPLADWYRVMDINFKGVVHGCHYFLPQMEAQRSGYVINTGSAASFFATPQMTLYNASKAAVLSLSETLRGEYREFGIRVSVIMPLFFQSKLAETLIGTPESKHMANTLIKRGITSDRVAKQVLNALGRKKPYIFVHKGSWFGFKLKGLFPLFWQWLTWKGYLAGKKRMELKKNKQG